MLSLLLINKTPGEACHEEEPQTDDEHDKVKVGPDVSVTENECT